MTIERQRPLELALHRLENERAHFERELEELQAELKGGGGSSTRTAKKTTRRRGRRKMTPAERSFD